MDLNSHDATVIIIMNHLISVLAVDIIFVVAASGDGYVKC